MNVFSNNNVMNHMLANLLSAALILIIGFLAAYLVRRYCKKWAHDHKHQTTLLFFINMVYALVLALTVITALSKLGVPTASLIAILGAASLAIGFALKDFLANIAAGFLIIFLKPFKIGDSVTVDSHAGTIIDINLFVTQLKSATNEALFLPNNKIVTNAIINKSFYPHRRVDLSVGIGYDSDLKMAKEAILNVLTETDFVLKKPASLVAVSNLGDSSVDLLVRFWVKKGDTVASPMAMLEKIKIRLDDVGIEIPFPQMDVSLKK